MSWRALRIIYPVGVHALPQDERDSLEDYAQEAAWEAARDDDEDHYICGRLTARGIL